MLGWFISRSSDAALAAAWARLHANVAAYDPAIMLDGAGVGADPEGDALLAAVEEAARSDVPLAPASSAQRKRVVHSSLKDA